jgi:hypothetical protein
MNPWKSIALSDYEAHMALPAVGQAAMLAAEFAKAVADVQPRSLALVGCAGGNGLDQIAGTAFDRVICVDINGSYLEQLTARYQRTIPHLECHACELEGFRTCGTVDLVFGGLVFEYTRLGEAIEAVALLLATGGAFVALIQMPASGMPTVSPSPYAQALDGVVDFFQYVEPGVLAAVAAERGLALGEQRSLVLESGKSFSVLTFTKAQPGG